MIATKRSRRPMTPGSKNDRSALPQPIVELVRRFEQHGESYRSGRYSEAQLRHDFLDPFWEALGWDVHNKQGYAEAYRDVIYEGAIRVGSATKAPDYSFRIGGLRKFFLEAKKPSVDVKDDVHPAYQLRRYAWSAKLPLSVLSDFEEFAVYDTRVRPHKNDSASAARVFYCTLEEYAEKWDWISSIFGRDAVLKGSFDKFAVDTRAKRGTTAVDDAFLKEIESWRDTLARNLALRNPGLTRRELNFAVQRIIDRIIFLRICEDRNIEDYGRLLALVNGGDIYGRLCELFREADDRYNSGLFHFKVERGRDEPPDELTPGLKVDDKLLRNILHSLYYPESPYEFSVLPADILGQAYERFLGKTIRLTPSHRAVVEDKPEVKKAGGIYYTPTYIVDYIVKNTVGKLLEDRTPTQASRLRILDPACGSGSFLIGAYQYLLDWHLDWYSVHDPGKRAKGNKPALVQAAGGGWKLTIAERKRILLNNIFGVDIDSQAVEVTKLSLLLKVLEGETEQTLQPMLRFLHERALPDLGENIKCGNSLIGPEFYEGKQMSLPDDEERLRINVFDWEEEFSAIMNGGGFDVVVGNPPYVLLQILNQRPVFDYLHCYYRTARYKIDTYQVFIEKAVKLARETGKVGFISPNTFLRNKHARELRACILESCGVDILRLFQYPVFAGASVDTSIITLTKTAKPNPKHKVLCLVSQSLSDLGSPKYQRQEIWHRHSEFNFSLPGESGSDEVIARIDSESLRLGEFATAYFGIQTFDRKKFVTTRREAGHFKPVVDGGHLQRYRLLSGNEFVDFRPIAIKSGGKQAVYEQERICVRQIGEVPVGTLVPRGIYTLNTIYNIFPICETAYDLRFILGILLSRLVGWYWRCCFFDQKQTFPKIKKDALLAVPVVRLNFGVNAEKAKHGSMVELVERMLDLSRKQTAARTEAEQTALERQIAAVDVQIDRLVYELYGLTEQEIEIVESAT